MATGIKALASSVTQLYGMTAILLGAEASSPTVFNIQMPQLSPSNSIGHSDIEAPGCWIVEDVNGQGITAIDSYGPHRLADLQKLYQMHDYRLPYLSLIIHTIDALLPALSAQHLQS